MKPGASKRRLMIGATSLFFVILGLSFFNNCSQSSKLTGDTQNGSTVTPSTTPTITPEPTPTPLPTPMPILPPQKATPSLTLDFTQRSPLVTVNGLQQNSLINFSRNSVASYYGDDGLIKIADVNTPRLNHDPTLCENPTESIANNCLRKNLGLQFESGSTNRLLNSSNFSLWSFGVATTLTPNAGIAPDGTVSATRVQFPNLSGTFILQTVLEAGKTYTGSFYAKANGQNQICLLVGNAVILMNTYNLTNQWQRFSINFVADAATTTFEINNDCITGGLVDALIWGAQVEEGNVATSYIPTGPTAVTRAQDQLVITSDLSWLNPLEGTWFVEWNGKIQSQNSEQILFSLASAAGDNIHRISRKSNESSASYQLRIPGLANSALTTSASGVDWTSNTGNRGVYATFNNSLMVVNEVNGVTQSSKTNSLTSLPTGMTTLSLGYNFINGSGILNSHIRKLQFFKKALPADHLAELMNSVKP